MGVFEELEIQHREEVIHRWVQRLLKEKTSPYSRESESDLHITVSQAYDGFRLVLTGGAWDYLDSFIAHIARKRLAQGFRLSDVQKAFMVYQEVAAPFLVKAGQAEELSDAILRLGSCISQTVGKFSDYYQGLHDEFMRQQTVLLENEVRKRTIELSESESKYKALVEDIRDGYFVIQEGIIVFANNAFCTMHGRSRAEMLGVPFLELVAQESREKVGRSYERSLTQQTSRLVEFLRLHQDGRKLPTETLAKSSFYEGRAATLGICRDISERRALEQKTREAETLNALAQQAASLAHDIRNPLTAIKMNVQMLAEELKDNPIYHRLIKISQKEVEGIERSVEEMMDLARPFRLNREIVVLGPFIQDCVASLRTRMAHKEVEATVRLSSELEQLWIDPHRMEQTMVNLLFNAIEAVPRGGHIYVSSGRVKFQGRQWGRISVADDGPGIPRELLPYVFDEKRSRRIGLGLDNVKKIVEAHGGVVDVSLRRPRGLRVSLRLPLEQ